MLRRVRNRLLAKGFCLLLAAAGFLAIYAERGLAEVDRSWVWCYPPSPLTYCVTPGAAAWGPKLKTAAKTWVENTNWEINEVANCADARIIVKVTKRPMLNVLAGDTDAVAQVSATACGTEDMYGVLKPCVKQVTMTFYSDVDWTANDELNAALHEFGHALGLNHSDGANDIMRKSNTNNHTLTPKDVDEGAESFGRSNLYQRHKRIPPLGGELALAGISIQIPEHALAATTLIGVRPLSGHSLPSDSRLPAGYDRIVAAAQVGPEWSRGEIRVGAMYRQKHVALRRGFSLEFSIKDLDRNGIMMPFQYRQGFLESPVDVKSLSLAIYNAETKAWIPIETKSSDGDNLRLSAVATEFGKFAVIAKHVKSAEEK